MATADPIENNPALWQTALPWPDDASHKYARGALGCVTGGPASTGAARLAARAGLRVGAGLVSLLSPPEAVLVNAAHETSIMVKPYRDIEALTALYDGCNAVILGPGAGVGDKTREAADLLLASQAKAVLDADALTVFREDPARLFRLLRPEDVLTPHPGEFGRIFPGLLDRKDRVDATCEAARTAGCICLLKGAETVIAAPDGRCVINRHGNAFLATAGSGDVLAGLIGGLVTQGMASFEATCAGVWIHGDGALRFGPGLISEDLPGLVPQTLAALHDNRT